MPLYDLEYIPASFHNIHCFFYNALIYNMNLLYKNINNQIIQYIYFKLLKYLILRENLILIKKIVQKTYKNSTK